LDQDKRLLDDFLALFLAIIAFYAATYYVFNMSIPIGDLNIINSIKSKLASSAGYPQLLYPTFMYIFYEKLFLFSQFFGNELGLELTSRVINCTLYSINGILFYHLSKRYLSSKWNILGIFLFFSSPALFYSAIEIRPAGLLVLELLIITLVVEKLIESPKIKIYHFLSGIISGLAIATKFNPSYFFIYLFGILYLYLNQSRLPKKIDLSLAAFGLIISLPIGWPTIWGFGNYFNTPGVSDNFYFSNFPGFGKAIEETWSFPYGKYSMGLVIILSFAAGILNYILFWVGAALRIYSKRFLFIWIFHIPIYLILIFNFTLYRMSHMFTLAVPAIILGATILLRYLTHRWGPKIFIPLLFPLIILSLIQTPIQADIASGFAQIVKQEIPTKFTDEGPLLLITNYNNNEIKGDQIDLYIQNKRPKTIIALDSFLYNYCKYKNNKIYIRHCSFFKKLLNGQAGYRSEVFSEINFPLKRFFDFDFLKFYLLTRID